MTNNHKKIKTVILCWFEEQSKIRLFKGKTIKTKIAFLMQYLRE